MRNKLRIGLLVAGVKGCNFLQRIQDCFAPEFVCSYEVRGLLGDSLGRIKRLCNAKKYRFLQKAKFLSRDAGRADLIFVAGWQYMIDQVDDRFVVFHDSLLPRFRGFSPTVSALVQGETEIGVSAVRPTKMADCGPIYLRVPVPIRYPMKIRDAYELLGEAYCRAAREIIRRKNGGRLTCAPQRDHMATYSLWRDGIDYEIDWNWDSNRISRFVDATGWPYAGATTSDRYGKPIVIQEASVVEDCRIENRTPGKIFRIEDEGPVVVCGAGLLRIDSATSRDGRPFEFSGLRNRLGNPNRYSTTFLRRPICPSGRDC